MSLNSKMKPEIGLLAYFIIFMYLIFSIKSREQEIYTCNGANLYIINVVLLTFYLYMIFVMLNYKYNFKKIGKISILLFAVIFFSSSLGNISFFIEDIKIPVCQEVFSEYLKEDLKSCTFIAIIIESIIFIILMIKLTKKQKIN